MKILFVTPWFPSKNAKRPEAKQGLFEYRTVLEMSKRNHQFTVVSIAWRSQSMLETYSDNIIVYRIKPLLIIPKIRYPIPNLLYLKNLLQKIIKKDKPEIVVYSHIAYLTAFPCIWINETPSVVTTDGFPGVSWFYGNRIVDLCGRIYTKYIMTKIIKSSVGLQLFHAGLINDLDKLKLRHNNVFVCSRGVDIYKFKPQPDKQESRIKLGLTQDNFVLMYVGRLDLVKGVRYLIESVKILSEKYSYIMLLIVGEGSVKQELVRMAGSHKNIMFLGYRDDVAELMRTADVFILPSLSEGIPNVIMEASSSGLPVIATNVGGVSEILTRETGILISPKNVGALIMAIEQLINNPQLRLQMGEAGRKKALSDFSWSIVCEKMENGYLNTIKTYYQKYNT